MGDFNKKYYKITEKRTGVLNPEDYKAYINPRLITIKYQDGTGLKIADHHLRHMLRDAEITLRNLPRLEGVSQLFNRVRAGIKMPASIQESKIDLDDAAFLLDVLYAGQTQYVDADDKLGMKL